MDDLKATIRDREMELQREQLKTSKLLRDAGKNRATAPLPKPNIPADDNEQSISSQNKDVKAASERADIMESMLHLQELNKAQNIEKVES